MTLPSIKTSKGLQTVAKNLEKNLTKLAGGKVHYCLLVFHNEPGSRMNYISNAMESLIKGWREGMPDIPAHEVN